MNIALQRLSSSCPRRHVPVLDTGAGIHVPAPGFRLGGRNDGGLGPVFIALVWPSRGHSPSRPHVIAMKIEPPTCHCHENRLAALPPSLPRKRESRPPHPWVPACAGTTGWGNRHFHPHTWPSQGHGNSEPPPHVIPSRRRGIQGTLMSSTPRHEATGPVLLAGMDRFLTPLRCVRNDRRGIVRRNGAQGGEMPPGPGVAPRPRSASPGTPKSLRVRGSGDEGCSKLFSRWTQDH